MKEFCGHSTAILDNGFLRLEYLTDVGPRIARFFPAGSDVNLLAEFPDFRVDTPYGRYQFMGGHRLWHSPEIMPRTYIPDQPVTVATLPDGIRLTASPEPGSGMTKSIEIHLHSGRAVATIRHEIRNDGMWSAELAPWALTMFRQGGTAILPQPMGNVDSSGLLPNRNLSLWPYTNINDQRLKLDDDFILLKADPALPPCKIGYYNPHGWMGYWFEGRLFVKRFGTSPGEPHADGGCNAEVYCNDRFIELESLGPLVNIAPGETIMHEETWELFDSLDQPFIPAALQIKN
jgi:hypothetical protein